MSESQGAAGSTSRRFFLGSDKRYFQLFTFSQSKADASIYVASPHFGDVKWLTPSPEGALYAIDSPATGKLSVHGSGVTHVRGDSEAEPKIRLAGNSLQDPEKGTLGVRHLFTVLIAEPAHNPNSPAFNRKSDYVLTTPRIVPYVFVFWAIPAVRKLSVRVGAAFHVDDLESVPPDSGFGVFPLLLHSVVWFAYRTKHLGRWPANPHVCFHDGHLVPLVIGTAEGECRLELRRPSCSLKNDELNILA